MQLYVLKQKGNNINGIKIYRLVKGLIFLILLLFVRNIFGQKKVEKSITSKANRIVIEFNVIDEIKLTSSEEDLKIDLIADSRDNTSPNVILEEINGIVFIKSQEIFIDNNELEVDKLCSVQPNYTSYQINIPKGKIIDVSYTHGNFYTNNFKGDLNLKVEEGIVKINHFEGSVYVHINVGNVYIEGINDSKIDVRSNLGTITSNLQLKDTVQNKSHIIDVFGSNFNDLNINAILANIHLKSLKN